MKKQYINISAIIGIIYIIGILLGNIIISYVQEKNFSIEPTTQTEPMVYLEKPQAVKNFLYRGETSSSGGRFLDINLDEETTHTNEENNIVTNKPSTKAESTTENTTKHTVETTTKKENEVVEDKTKVETDTSSTDNEEITNAKPIINADSYICSLDDIYYTSPIRTYTEEQKELLAKMLFCEAGGEGWDCQVATCSAIINFIENYGGSFSVLDNVNKFEPAPYYRYKTPTEMNYQVLDYVLSGHLIANIKYFRIDYYHNFGTPMFEVDNVYFSK